MSYYPPGFEPSMADFRKQWTLAPSPFANGGQGEIYETFPTQCCRNKHLQFVTKIIKLNPRRRSTYGELNSIYHCYAFVKRHALLNIYGIYHDRSNSRLLIVMQRLDHELDEEYLCDTDSLQSFRFSKPGHIYLNYEYSLKLFVYQIAKQLDTIHKHHCIHFDVKPGNIMFNAVLNRWCLIDYDLMLNMAEYNKYCNADKENRGGLDTAMRDGEHDEDDEVKATSMKVDHYRGTQSWTSPEMSTRAHQGKPSSITAKTDVFSFGLVILWMLNGGWQPYLLNEQDVEHVHCKELIERPSWRRDTVYFGKVLKGGYKYICNHIDELVEDQLISDGLSDLLKKMLQFDVAKRFNSRQILTHKWLDKIS